MNIPKTLLRASLISAYLYWQAMGHIASAAPIVSIRVVPEQTTINLKTDRQPRTLIARVNLEGVSYAWTLKGGPGRLDGDLSSRKITYLPPENLAESATVTISVKAAEERAGSATAQIVFTLLPTKKAAPTPTVTPTISSKQHESSKIKRKAFYFQCRDTGEILPPGTYQFGAFLHSVSARSRRTPEKKMNASVRAWLVPYLRDEQNTTYYSFVFGGENATEWTYFLECDKTPYEVAQEQDDHAETYFHILLNPVVQGNSPKKEIAAKQRMLADYLTKKRRGCEFLPLVPFDVPSPPKIDEAQIAGQIIQTLQSVAPEHRRIPCLDEWIDDEIAIGALEGYDYYTENVGFRYAKPPKEGDSVTPTPVVATATPTPPPANIRVQVILPPIFARLDDLSKKIHVTNCRNFVRAADRNTYTGECAAPPVTPITLDGFTNPSQVPEIPAVLLQESKTQSEAMMVVSKDILARVSLRLNEVAGDTMYAFKDYSKFQFTSNSSTFYIPLKETLPTYTFDVASLLRSEKNAATCAMTHQFTRAELSGAPVVLTPPCVETAISVVGTIPLPATAAPCLRQSTRDGTLFCLREREEALTLAWKEADRIQPVTITAEALNAKRQRYAISLIERAAVSVFFTLPGILSAGDLSGQLVPPDACDALSRAADGTYVMTCPRTALAALPGKTLTIRGAGARTLALKIEQVSGVDRKTLQIGLAETFVSADVVMSSDPGMPYGWVTPGTGEVVPIQAGQPFAPLVTLASPTVTIRPTESAYASQCQATAPLNLLAWLRGEALLLAAPCERERLRFDSAAGDLPTITGCLGISVSSSSGIDCVRKKGETIQYSWKGGKLFSLSDAELDTDNELVVRAPLPVVIDSTNVPYNPNARFLLFESEAACTAGDVSRGGTIYTRASLDTLQVFDGGWGVVASGTQRLSHCVQGALQADHTILFSMQSNKKRVVIAIENSRYFADEGRGNAFREALIEWLRRQKASNRPTSVSFVVIQGNGQIEQILQDEELEFLPVEADDPKTLSIVKKINNSLTFVDEGFQALKHFGSLEMMFPAEILGKVLYVTDSQNIPGRLTGEAGPLFLWKMHQIRANILTSASCDAWRDYEDNKLLRCSRLQEFPSSQDILEVLDQSLIQ